MGMGGKQLWYNYKRMRRFLKKSFCFLGAFVFVVLSPFPTYALDNTKLNIFSQNNILFYNPDDGCKVTPNGVYKGEQYTLTDEEIAGFARAAENENSCNINAIKSELSLMANLYEKKGSSYSSIAKYVTDGGWFSGGTVAAFKNSSKTPKSEYIDAVKEVLVNGNRVLPPEIDEHDCVGDLEWVEVNGEKHYGSNPGGCRGTGLGDKSLYVSGKTVIHNKYGSTYTFYQWAGGKDSTCGDPFGYTDGNPGESYSNVAGNNTNYAGDQVWSDVEMQRIEENRAIYEEAANKYNFPWQLLAVFHSLETSLRRYNPPAQWDASKSEGVYQLHSWAKSGRINMDAKESITEEEFREQTFWAAEFIVESYKNYDLNDPNDLKRVFFGFNGTSQKYIDKALAMGFTQEEAERGEGSAYVMNRYDARRDPTSSEMDPNWPGRYVRDYQYDPNSTSDGFGAFVKYEALAGTSYCSGAGGPIAEVAKQLSWPDQTHSKFDPKPEYVTAMKEVDAYRKGCNDSGCAPEGASCDQFVGTVMRYSKADPEFPIFGPCWAQKKHMDDHPEMYMRVDANGDVEKLQPGDIFVTCDNGDHIYVYIGKIDGLHAQASASFNDRTGENFQSVYFEDHYGSKGDKIRHYEVYRRLNQ